MQVPYDPGKAFAFFRLLTSDVAFVGRAILLQYKCATQPQPDSIGTAGQKPQEHNTPAAVTPYSGLCYFDESFFCILRIAPVLFPKLLRNIFHRKKRNQSTGCATLYYRRMNGSITASIYLRYYSGMAQVLRRHCAVCDAGWVVIDQWERATGM